MTDTDRQSTSAPFLGLARLMTMVYHGEDTQLLATELLARAQADDADALMDLSILLQLRGEPDTALAVQRQALLLQQCYRLPAESERPAVRLLALSAPGAIMWNTPLEFLVQDSDVALEMLYIDAELPLPEILPDHDVMIVAIAQSTANRPLLESLKDAAAHWPRPVLNPPEKILQLTRDRLWTELADISGVLMPGTVKIDRRQLESIGDREQDGALLPGAGRDAMIIRPVDSHAGHHLAKLDTVADLPQYLQETSADAFYLSKFVDYRGSDGQYRKIRVTMIDGKPYASHMAISEHWMIHYLNAGMAESASKRAEEARFMAQFDDEFATRHARALAAIHERLGLDYYSIDCAETQYGELLIFEVDSAMVVHAMDPIADFSYKHDYMPKVFSAFRQLLLDRRVPGDGA